MTHFDYSRRRYLIVIKNLTFLYSHFWSIAKAVQDAGWEVWIAADFDADPQRIRDAGMKYIELHTAAGFRHVISELRAIVELNAALRQVKPDVVHFIYLKNVLTGGILARLNKIPAVIGAVTGLGSLFAEDRVTYRILRGAVVAGFRIGFRNGRSLMAFENVDDQRFFVQHRAIRRERSWIIPGAGLDRDAVTQVPWQGKVPVVLCASRMIRNKGIFDLIDACREVRRRGHDFELWLAGDVDTGNPTSLTEKELKSAEMKGMVRWLGHRSDILDLLQKASIFCLPTYYREGLPRVLVEAGAAGRPAVTTDVSGCREIVKHGINGLLIPPRDIGALADALEYLLLDRSVRDRMGTAARRIFEDSFTLEAVLNAFNQCYKILAVPLTLNPPGQGISTYPPKDYSLPADKY
jgi:glycosyltransferase involved in cell wall biosynthesis